MERNKCYLTCAGKQDTDCGLEEEVDLLTLNSLTLHFPLMHVSSECGLHRVPSVTFRPIRRNSKTSASPLSSALETAIPRQMSEQTSSEARMAEDTASQ